jgi:hypothetical protein
MFGWDFQNSKSDRIKLFLFVLSIFLVVGFTASFIFRHLSTGEVVAKANKSQHVVESTEAVDSSNTDGSEEELSKNIDQYDQTEHFSNEDLEKTKEIADNFAKAFHLYNADQPMQYLENAKPYMTARLYQKMKRSIRREPLDRSYLSVKETDVTPVANSSSLVVRWNVIVRGEAKATDGTTSQTEDWYLVSVGKENGEWKVEDVRVNVSN